MYAVKTPYSLCRLRRFETAGSSRLQLGSGRQTALVLQTGRTVVDPNRSFGAFARSADARPPSGAPPAGRPVRPPRPSLHRHRILLHRVVLLRKQSVGGPFRQLQPAASVDVLPRWSSDRRRLRSRRRRRRRRPRRLVRRGGEQTAHLVARRRGHVLPRNDPSRQRIRRELHDRRNGRRRAGAERWRQRRRRGRLPAAVAEFGVLLLPDCDRRIVGIVSFLLPDRGGGSGRRPAETGSRFPTVGDAAGFRRTAPSASAADAGSGISAPAAEVDRRVVVAKFVLLSGLLFPAAGRRRCRCRRRVLTVQRRHRLLRGRFVPAFFFLR